MPLAAIRTEHVDLVLSPDKMGEEIMEYVKNPAGLLGERDVANGYTDEVSEILNLLSKRTQTDFTRYKQSTIIRRLEKRLTAVKTISLKEYINYIKSHPQELDNLFQTVLIGVTEFFRDIEAFNEIEKLLGNILKAKAAREPIRMWIAGCATGEEAYSFGILVSKILGSEISEHPVQIFATDIDEKALEHARKGIYPKEAVANLPQQIINRYFIRTKNGGYEISKTIRSMIFFSRHDATSNPPFLKLDLISCRNVLIYFNLELQRHLISLFHYALNPDGILFLGKSETVGQYSDLFSTENGTYKIFKRNAGVNFRNLNLAYLQPSRSLISETSPLREKNKFTINEMIKETLFKTYDHPFVVVNNTMDVQEIYGDVRLFMSLQEGVMNANIMKMINKDLNIELHSLLSKAIKERMLVRGRIKKFEFFEKTHFVRIIVKPLIYSQLSSDLYIVIFEMLNEEDNAVLLSGINTETPDPRISELEKELSATREHLQTYVEELETSNEELQSLNEELQATNEELQSSNEELETSNEELQSTNEELHSAYSELKQLNSMILQKDEALKTTDAYLQTLVNNVPDGLILISAESKIQIYNLTAYRLLKNLFNTGVREGEPIYNYISGNLAEEIRNKIHLALKGKSIEGQHVSVRNRKKEEYHLLLSFIPVKQSKGEVKSILLILKDITQSELQSVKMKIQEKLFSSVFKLVPFGICITDSKGYFVDFNDKYCKIYGYKRNELLGKHFTIVVKPNQRKEARKLHDDFISSGKEPPAVWEVVRKDKKKIKISVEAVLMQEEGNKFKVTLIKLLDKIN